MRSMPQSSESQIRNCPTLRVQGRPTHIVESPQTSHFLSVRKHTIKALHKNRPVVQMVTLWVAVYN
jgi:hypothetical protein